MDWRRTAAVLATVSLVAIGLLGVLTAPAGALITITVANNADSGAGSVRQAFIDASTTDNTDDVLIVVPASVGNISLTSGQLQYFGTHNLTVQGGGNTITQTDGVDRVMADTGAGSALSVSGLTLTGGQGADEGEGVAVQGAGGSLTLTNMTVTNNHTTDDGGGVFSSGAVTVTNSTISANSSNGGGGGISTDGNVTVTNSTITGNTTTGGPGGGIRAGSVTLIYATVTGNNSSDSANVSADGSLTAFGSVVADALGGGPNCVVGTTTSHGFNDEDDVAASCGFATSTGDLAPGTAPLLGSLANNGGPTQTELPQTGSPLVDAIPTADCGAGVGITTDQRGVTRPQGPGCDVGAVEVQVVVPSAPTVTAAFTG